MNILNFNTVNRATGLLLSVLLIALAGLTLGCEAKTDAPAKSEANEAPGATQELPHEQKKEVDVLSSREFKTLSGSLTEEAAKEITPQNAKAMVEELQKEIDADIAANQ